MLLAAILLFQGGWLSIPGSIVSFYYYAVFIAGIVLAWRFHSSRMLLVLILLLLAERAIEFFSAAPKLPAYGPGRIAFEAISFLLPLNLLFFGKVRERGLALPALTPRLLVIFVQCVFVAVLCRPEQKSGVSPLHGLLLKPEWFRWTEIPPISMLAFALAAALLFLHFLSHRKPQESGLFWALISSFLALQSGAIGRTPRAFFATAGLFLLIAIVETSYSMAYHDELTGLPARRAFNEALLALQDPYAVAMVDIDHFKQFNDTYGHETGDQVLRLVAAKLALVTGGGKAYRCGGEEFAILFPGVSLSEVTQHLELVRHNIEDAAFHIRGGDRRSTPRQTDRRRAQVRRGKISRAAARPPSRARRVVSVTVSIGAAEPTGKIREIEQVIDRADQALYRAKAGGRNRVETAS
ncbi:MAG TPA: GGDEF domain-containing protein [Terriglobales bacterium]|nr:GGDEF domain-containing protein [Terriglobales bacterium]